MDDMAARDAAIAFMWDKVILQGLSDHMVTNQYFHCSIEIGFQQLQGTKIGNLDSSRLLLQEHLEAGLQVGEGVAMLKCHFSNQCVKLCNPRAIHTCLVVAIVEPRVG